MKFCLAIFVFLITSSSALAADHFIINDKKVEVLTVFNPSQNSVVLIVEPEYGLWIHPGSPEAIQLRNACLSALDNLIAKFEGVDRKQTAECKIVKSADVIGFVSGQINAREAANKTFLLEKYKDDCIKAYSSPNLTYGPTQAVKICNGEVKE